MNSDNKPNNNKGSYNHRNSKKPYYMKKHNRHNADKSAHDAEAKVENLNEKSEVSEVTEVKAEAVERVSENPVENQEQNREFNRFKNRDKRGHNRGFNNGENKNTPAESENSKDKEPEFSEDDIRESSVAVAAADENGNLAQDGSDMTPTVTVSIESESPKKTISVSGIRFKNSGKIYYFDRGNLSVSTGDSVIVETARGLEFGEVAFGAKDIKEESLVLPLKPIVRIATPEDIEHNKENKARETEAFGICLEKIKKHGLDMKLIEVQYSFDNTKLLFYFTSANRVDFRELVKDLASVFKTRIELRQIGIRDEAKIMGGLGSCGRPLCCSTFLSDFAQVSIKMAKEQNLSLNSGKISGCCGRLMCCLQFEHKTYAEETAKTPPVESIVKTADGVGTVTETNPLAGLIKVRLKDKPDTPPVQYKRDDVVVISRAVVKDDD